ncbi:MAG: hypothetical protein HY985_07705 [Magnetospirillum sp.]|nr:hypothetical protein [Magnetospirillum sp.]
MRRVPLALLVLLAAAPAGAAERLLVPQFTGWTVVANVVEPGAELTDLVPSGESAAVWNRRTTVQAFRGSTLTATSVLDLVAMRDNEICDGVGAEPIRPAQVGGAVEAASRLIACARIKADGLPQVSVIHAVRGRDALYVLTRAWRSAAVPPGELAEWHGVLTMAALCDTRDSKRPCAR